MDLSAYSNTIIQVNWRPNVLQEKGETFCFVTFPSALPPLSKCTQSFPSQLLSVCSLLASLNHVAQYNYRPRTDLLLFKLSRQFQAYFQRLYSNHHKVETYWTCLDNLNSAMEHKNQIRLRRSSSRKCKILSRINFYEGIRCEIPGELPNNQSSANSLIKLLTTFIFCLREQ